MRRQEPDKERKRSRILSMKQEISVDALCAGLPAQFAVLLAYARLSLGVREDSL